MGSPYDNRIVSEWQSITKSLVHNHPLDEKEIVGIVLEAWDRILITKIGGELQIGIDIFPSPQILGNYLHELIPVILNRKYPQLWRKEHTKGDKDMVYIPDDKFSIEIKTSSNANNIYGNRSYGQENSDSNSGKSKHGYYQTINFEKFDSLSTDTKPKIKKIRFGWVDHSDWKAQAAATGQQSSLSIEARDNKLLLLYKK